MNFLKKYIYFIIILFFLFSASIVFFTINLNSNQPNNFLSVKIHNVPISYIDSRICNKNKECIYNSFYKLFNKTLKELKLKHLSIDENIYIFKKDNLVYESQKDELQKKYLNFLKNSFDKYIKKIIDENKNIDLELKSDFFKDEIFLHNLISEQWVKNLSQNLIITFEKERSLFTIYDNLQRFYDVMFVLFLLSLIYLIFYLINKKN